MVESGDQEHSFVFNIMEIQPFHRAAAIQAISLDADRVSYPTLLCNLGTTQQLAEERATAFAVCVPFQGPPGWQSPFFKG